MASKTYKTIIVGAGISGLACAKHLQDSNEDFLIISKDIGGRILTSSDGAVNYGAFFICSDYHNVLKYVKIKYEIILRDFCFHEENDSYILFEPRFLAYSIQFFKVLKILYKFRKKLRKFRKTSENISQKKIEMQSLSIPFILDLKKDDIIFVEDNLNLFLEYGLDIRILSKNSIAIDSIPSFISEKDILKLFNLILEETTVFGDKKLAKKISLISKKEFTKEQAILIFRKLHKDLLEESVILKKEDISSFFKDKNNRKIKKWR